MKVKRKIVEIDGERCNGCGQCVLSCAEGAIKIVDGKARLISDQYCDGLGACLGECPQDALRIIERDADEFDEQAVEKHLQGSASHHPVPSDIPAAGCTSARTRILSQGQKNRKQAHAAAGGDAERQSALAHWPVQIRLVQPEASFLRNADLLVAADCTPVAYPDFHRDFLKGKAVMIGCPKFDDAALYQEKFARIFKTAGIKSVTVVVMEVPCCQGLPQIVKAGMDQAGVSIPIEKVVVSAEGEILQRGSIAG
jgi:Pyruvate/2-oxoacid:ferredoxin oxidoreductase delta subunit